MSYKQVIVIRRDLKMRRGKEVAQGAHASLAFLLAGYDSDRKQVSLLVSEAEANWIEKGQRKICVRVNSEEELLELHKRSQELGVKSHLIMDSGKTEFAGQKTYTCLAVGPDQSEKVDLVTGHLELM